MKKADLGSWSRNRRFHDSWYLKNTTLIFSSSVCCRWTLLSAIYPAPRQAHRVTKYLPYAQELDFSGIDFPATLADVDKVRPCVHVVI